MIKREKPASIKKGEIIILDYAQKLPNTPGVYRMLSENGEPLYVGKAKSLKKRVMSYTRPEKLPVRLQRMIALTKTMEFVHTHTEVEALLLESNLIKKFKPRFNILLRDDKSFPYILITDGHDFPQVVKHRGAKKRKGEYFGPFASAGDVNRTITTLQRVFMLRNCTDSYFAARHRPCLQYHIKRCTAPCVGEVTKGEYALQISEAKEFMEGKSKAIQTRMAKAMQDASDEQNFEAAATYRDRLRALTAIQSRQDINIEGIRNADVMALIQIEGRSCVQVFFFRAGHNHGNRVYFPSHGADEKQEAIIAAFIAQFYENKPITKELIVNIEPEEKALLQDALSLKLKSRMQITKPVRGVKKRVLDFAINNTQAALKQNIALKASEIKLIRGVADCLKMNELPKRIEVYDNSHISGTNMVGAMIVSDMDGFNKNAYRKFNIKTADAADDYGMMREVLTRRFKRALGDMPDMMGDGWPDLLLIDGGQGQLSACREVLEECGVLDFLTLVAISKGPDRNAGREQFHMIDRPPFQLPIDDPVLFYLQRLRDEAHRFAIGTHRARRTKQITSSPLDAISGVGAKRKKALLLYFGSAKAIASAGIEDLQNVEGISKAVAQTIYDYFH